MKITTTNGETYNPKYHIVCEGRRLEPGDYVRCVGERECVLCEGSIAIPPKNNYFNVTDIYL